MSKAEKIVEAATSLLLFKIQFDKRFDSINNIIQSENREDFEELKESVDKSITLTNQIKYRVSLLKLKV